MSNNRTSEQPRIQFHQPQFQQAQPQYQFPTATFPDQDTVNNTQNRNFSTHGRQASRVSNANQFQQVRYPSQHNAPQYSNTPGTGHGHPQHLPNAPGPWSNAPQNFVYPANMPMQINQPNQLMSQMQYANLPAGFAYQLPPGGYMHQGQMMPHPSYPANFIQHGIPTVAGVQVSHPSQYQPPQVAQASGASASIGNQGQAVQTGARQQQQPQHAHMHAQQQHQQSLQQQQQQAQPAQTTVSASHPTQPTAYHLAPAPQPTPPPPPAPKSSKAIPIVDPKTNQQVNISKTPTTVTQTTSTSSSRPASRDTVSPKTNVTNATSTVTSLMEKPSSDTVTAKPVAKVSPHPAQDKQSVEKEMMMSVRAMTSGASSVPSIAATGASAPHKVPVPSSTDSHSQSFISPEPAVDSKDSQETSADSSTTSPHVEPQSAAKPVAEKTDKTLHSDKKDTSAAVFEALKPVLNGTVSPPEELNSSPLSVISREIVAEKPTYDFKPDKADSDKLTREKKLKYDRQFLYSLQQSKLSSQRPEELPKDMPDILVRNAEVGSDKFIGTAKNNTFMPSYVQSVSSPHQHKDKDKHKANMNYARQGSKSAKAPPKPIVIEFRKEKIDLHKSEDAYVPMFLKNQGDDEESKQTEIERHIRSVLNKITPQNFDSCFTQLTQCDIGSVHGLEACVDIIFEKATREVSYSSVFAEICKRLQFLKVNVKDQEQTEEEQRSMFVGYRSLLLKKCQCMFETPLKDQMIKRAEFWDEKIAAAPEEKKRSLEEEKDEAMKKVKDQFYGNIRFVGELFIKDILTANIIHKCIFDLLKADANMITESLECLCELLRTVGKKIEEESNAKERIDQYFTRIQKLIENTDKPLESKVKFKLIDIVEMRLRHWELREMERRLQERPMTKDELQKKERLEEEKKKMLQLQQQSMPRSGRGNYQNKPPVPQGAGPVQAGGEWQHVTASKKSQKVDAKKLVIGSQAGGEIRLGPGRHNRYMGPGAAGGRQDNGRPSTPTRVSGSSKNSRESSTSRGASRDASPHPDSTPSGAKLGIPRSASSVELPSRAMTEDSSPSVLPKALLERKSRNIMDEWLGSLCTFEETKQNVLEISVHPDVKLFVETNVDFLINESNRDLRERGSRLFYKLMVLHLLKPCDFVEGFCTFIENAEDIMVDVPHLFVYFGEIFSQLIQKDRHYLTCVRDLIMKLDPALKGGRARAEILSKTLHLASARIGHDKVGDAFRSSHIQWEDIILPEEVDAFIQENNLEFTVKELQLSPSPIPLEKLGVRIQELTQTSATRDATEVTEGIFSLIEKEVDKAVTEEAGFCNILVRSICDSCICKGKVDKGLFKNLCPVFDRYIENLNQEMWCVKAVVETVIKAGLTSELLSEFFLAFLDASIISEDAFENWRSDEKRPEILDASDSFFKTLDSTKVHDS